MTISFPSGRVGEGVVEGIEGAIGCDHELEAIANTRVLDRDGELALVRVPEQQDLDAVALARGELADLRRCAAHDSSVPFGRAHDPTLGRRGDNRLVGESCSNSDQPTIPTPT